METHEEVAQHTTAMWPEEFRNLARSVLTKFEALCIVIQRLQDIVVRTCLAHAMVGAAVLPCEDEEITQEVKANMELREVQPLVVEHYVQDIVTTCTFHPLGPSVLQRLWLRPAF
eukprot:6220579-Amphidinium_carterae.1